jgi:hypothetical protein
MKMRSSILLALGFALLGTPSLAEAQRGPSVGSASGLGLGAMTEARGGESALWNPALAAIFDGPSSSWSVLSFHAEPGDFPLAHNLYKNRDAMRASSRSLLGEGTRNTFMRWAGDRDVSNLTGTATVQWAGVHSQDLSVSLTSIMDLDVQLPSRALRIAGGSESARLDLISGGDMERASRLRSRGSMVTVLAVGGGHSMGVIDYLGPTWIGGAFKASHVHSNVRGSVRYDEAAVLARAPNGGLRHPGTIIRSGEVGFEYSEVDVRSGRIYSFDAGAAFNPWGPLFVSATLANAVQWTSLNADGVVHRKFIFAGADSVGTPMAFVEEERLESFSGDRPWLDQAESLVAATHFMPNLRVGASLDTYTGRFFGGVALPLSSDLSIDRHSSDQFSAGFQLFHDLQPRISYSRRFDGSQIFEVSGTRGGCLLSYSLGVGYIARPHSPGSITLGFSRTAGQPPCGR